MHFMNDSFVNLGEYKAGYAQRLFKKTVHSDFAVHVSESATLSMFCY